MQTRGSSRSGHRSGKTLDRRQQREGHRTGKISCGMKAGDRESLKMKKYGAERQSERTIMSPHHRNGDETGRSVERVGVAGRPKNKTQKNK